MKARTLAMLTVSALTWATTFAQENSTEKTVVNKPDKVTITRDSTGVLISIDGKEGNPDYRYHNRFELGGGMAETLNEADNRHEWNFSLPFERKLKKVEKRRCTSVNVCGFGFGGVKAFDMPDGMEVDPASSYEFIWNILSITDDKNSDDQHWFHALGFGLNWKNYRMTNRKRFVKEGDMLTIGGYPEGAEPKFSRIKVFSLTVPLTIGYAFRNHISLKISPIINFNTYASVKTRYTDSEGKQKDFFKGIHQRPLTLDFQTTLSYRGFGFYVKCSPFTVLNTDFGPKFRGTSAGLIIGY